MSHIASVTLVVKDLDCLRAACTDLGLEFREGQTTYKWFGRWMNDYSAREAAVSNGFNPKEFGQSEHAIGVPGDSRAYEVGVVKNPNGPGYTLLYDNWQGGLGLEALIGKGADKLKQAYATRVATKEVQKRGYRVNRTQGADGRIRLVATR